MKITKLVCPSCNSDLEIEEDKKFITCKYCGTKVAISEEITQNINIKNYIIKENNQSKKHKENHDNHKTSISNLFKRAETYLNENDLISAYKYCERILDINCDYKPALNLKNKLVANGLVDEACYWEKRGYKELPYTLCQVALDYDANNQFAIDKIQYLEKQQANVVRILRIDNTIKYGFFIACETIIAVYYFNGSVADYLYELIFGLYIAAIIYAFCARS